MPPPSFSPTVNPPRVQPLWVMLLALLSGFALSQAYRTTTAIVAQGLQVDFGLQASSLGAFAGLFGLSFGVAQLLMGIALDRYGLRRTVLAAAPLGIAGAALSTLAPSYGWLMAGQLLIGVGYSPAFVACTLFIARHFAAERFAFFSGLCMGVGGLGLLFTGTPLAWMVQHWGWRMGFGVLTVLGALSWGLIFALVREPANPEGPPLTTESWGQSLARFVELLTVPHTWGIMVLGMSCYAAFLSLRGLWLGPLLIDRFGFSLLDSGNVALALSMIAMFTPAAFGRMDPGIRRRRAWIGNASLLMASLFAAMAFLHHGSATVALMILMGLLSGYSILQYSDVRSSYPPELTGRALSLFTMAMFLGVALMQSLTGAVGAWAGARGMEPYRVVLLAIAAWLALASLAFRLLPASPLLKQR
ncbi:MAG TPA: MFS transporter [Burkholderiaceae bacterium]